MRTLYLSINNAKESIQSVDRLEALAFAIQIKTAFVSSRLNNDQINTLKSKFNVGYDRLVRMIENGLKYGYLRRSNGFIISNKLYGPKDIVIRLDLEQKIYSNNQIKELIQRSVILDHINKVDFINNTLIQTTDMKKGYKARKYAVKKLYKYVRTIPTELIRLSYIRISEIANITRQKAIEFINIMVLKGIISKKYTFIRTNMKADHKDKAVQLSYKENMNRGYLRKIDQNYFIQLSNVYSITSNLIKRVH